MPLVKDRLLRFRVLDECFRDLSHSYRIDDLVEVCDREMQKVYGKSISKRSVQGDIKMMQEPPFNVEFDDKLRTMGYYRYADTDFVLNFFNLSEHERHALHETIAILQPVCADSHNPLYDWMLFCLRQMEMDKPVDLRTSNVSFSENEFLQGREHFAVLLNAVNSRQPLLVSYKPFREEQPALYHLFPYYLKEYHSRWFLLCKTQERPRMNVFPLDRMVEIKPWHAAYQPAGMNVAEYFDNIVGVTLYPNLVEEDVLLRVSAKFYPYLFTKPIHASQVELSDRRTPLTRTLRLHLRPNKEFKYLLLSYGADVEVLSPQWLRDDFADESLRLCAHYTHAAPDTDEE